MPAKDPASAVRDLNSLGPELVAERQVNAKVYAKPDGTRVAKVYADPIHFKDATGDLKEIDNRIVPEGSGFKNAAGPAEIRFAARADAPELLKVKEDENSISFRLEGASSPEGSISGSTLTYPSVMSGVDLQYVMSTNGVKELLVVNERPQSNADLSFRFVMDPGGLTPRTTKLGGVELVDGKNVVKFAIPPAVAWDSAPISKSVPDPAGAELKLIAEGGKWILELTGIGSWMTAPERQYPVFLDPTVAYLGQRLGTIGDDAYISNVAPDYPGRSVYWGNCCWINVSGTYFPTTFYQTFVKYDVTPFSNKKINVAHWWAYGADASYSPNAARITAVQAPQPGQPDWASLQITWNNKPLLRTDQRSARS